MYDYSDAEIYNSCDIGDPDPFFSVIRAFHLVDNLRGFIAYMAGDLKADWNAWASKLNSRYSVILQEDQKLTPDRAMALIRDTPILFKEFLVGADIDNEQSELRVAARDKALASDDVKAIRVYNSMYDPKHAGVAAAIVSAISTVETPTNVVFQLSVAEGDDA